MFDAQLYRDKEEVERSKQEGYVATTFDDLDYESYERASDLAERS